MTHPLQDYSFLTFILTTCTIGLPLNATCLTFFLRKRYRSVRDMILVVLGSVDVLTLLGGCLYWGVCSPRNPSQCSRDFYFAISYFYILSSAVTLVLAVVRVIAIARPFAIQRKRTVVRALGVAWVLLTLQLILSYVMWRNPDEVTTGALVIIVLVNGETVGVILAIIITTGILTYHLRRGNGDVPMATEGREGSGVARQARQRKATVTVFLISVVFVVAQTTAVLISIPLSRITLASEPAPDVSAKRLLLLFLQALALHLNSCINPAILLARNPNIKAMLRNSVLPPLRKLSVHVSITTHNEPSPGQ